ncbi:MAG: nucleotide exchange factor GrpE [Candidatus Limivicinus sp.]|jgi:molecular chaperone GrpE
MSTENKKTDTAAQAENAEEKKPEVQAEEIKSEEVKQEPEKKEAPAKDTKKSGKKNGKKPEKAAREEKTEKSAEAGKPAEETKKENPEIAALNDKYLRLYAEYDNFRRRSQKEKDSLYSEIKADTLAEFLPVYDNLVRALNQPTQDEAYRKGVEMIMNQFNTTMEKLGVKKIESLGKKFDPAYHNAVMHVDDEEKGENEITEVFQEGFIMGEKVIRFAMVKVAN